MNVPLLRHAQVGDVAELAAIRADHVLHTHSAFDVVPPTHDDVCEWLTQFSEESPYQLLVAVQDHTVLGYAGPLRYRPKPAFDGTAEMSVYLAPQCRSRGISTTWFQHSTSRDTDGRHGP